MIDWQDKVDRPRLQCVVTGDAIAPGATYFSGLRWTGSVFARDDISEDAWTDAPHADYVSWWQHRRPDGNDEDAAKRVDHAVLLSIFHDIKDSTDRHQQCFAWMLALLLVRAKKMRYLDLTTEGNDAWLLVEDRAHNVAHRIRDPRMTETEEVAVQSNLADVLGA